MKKFLSSAAAAFLIVAGSVTIGATAANATETYPVCTPSDAWTETIVVTPEVPGVPEVPAIPETPEISHTVQHPAETSVVHHEAVTHVEYHFAKFTQERTRTKERGKWSDWSSYGPWVKWTPETHTSWELSTTPLGSPQFHSEGTRDNNKTEWQRNWQAQYDGQQRSIEDKGAWDETVTTKDAWVETVIDQAFVPGVPAVPAIPAVPAVTKTVEHDAVTCPPVVPEQPKTIVTTTSSDSTDCKAGVITTTTNVTTSNRTEYNEDTNTWDPIADLVETSTSETAATAEDCPVVTPPTEEPPVVKPPVVTPPVVLTPEQPKPASNVTPKAAEVVSASDQLAQTGSNTNLTLPILGGILFLAGVVLLVIRRFRAAHN